MGTNHARRFWNDTERHHDLAEDFYRGIEWYVPDLKPYTVAQECPLHVRHQQR